MVKMENNSFIRFFGSSGCRDCLKLFVFLNKYSIPYEYIDANDESCEMQNFCDEHNVDQLPHIEFVVNNKVIFRHIGSLSESDLNKIHSLTLIISKENN